MTLGAYPRSFVLPCFLLLLLPLPVSCCVAKTKSPNGGTQLPMWVDNDSTGDPQGFLSPPSGLFPAPLPALVGDEGTGGAGAGAGSSAGGAGDGKGKALAMQRRSVIGRFRFLGRLAARCLMDGQVRRTTGERFLSSGTRSLLRLALF